MKLVVDHIDRNKLNNTLNNLRIVSNSENLNNRNKKESKGIYTYLTKQKIVRYCAYYSCK
ncbi:MAG: HNH endonuclease, partial [Saprospiraceae bacterium]|nr:HNH endonuclease [Saprospiraceae bacterium]